MIKITKTNLGLFLPKEFPVVFFHAHCDDESFLCSGLLQELITSNYQVYVIYFASGLVEGESKTIIRQNELIEACKILGLNNIVFLNFCEPKYNSNKSRPLFLQNDVTILVELEKIFYKKIKGNFSIISYDKNGGYGNRDHLIVHRIGRIILSKYRNKIKNFYEITINRSLYLNWFKRNRDKLPKKDLPKLDYWSRDFGLTESEITHYFELSLEQRQNKTKALLAHKSQIKPDEFPISLSFLDFSILFGREPFIKIN